MIAQSHKIMRQVLEVRGCPPDDERRIGSELRSLYFKRVVPLLEKVCSEVGSPGRIHRVDRLEVDLGRVAPARLEPHFGDRFEAVLRERLADAIAGSVQADSELELFDWFVRTGTLPWWADASDGDVVQGALATLLERDPRGLVAILRTAPDPERARQRITRACADPLLEELTLVMAPTLRAECPDVSAWVTALRRTRGGGVGSVAARHVVWEEVLRAAEACDASGGGAAGFFGAVVTRVTRRGGPRYAATVRALHRALPVGAPGVPSWMREVVDDLLGGLGREEGRMQGEAGSRGRRAPADRAAGREASGHPRAGHRPGDHVGEADPRSGPDGTTSPRRPIPPGETTKEASESGGAQGTRGRRRDVGAPVPGAEVREVEGPPRGVNAPPRRVAGETQELDARVRARPDAIREWAGEAGSAPPRPDPTFSDIDAIYVDNAGLVILWPFLERFFDRLELLHERRFTDDAAAHRAAGLLQLVAGTEGTPPEHLVSLNKVLCGIAPDEVFDFGDDVTDPEAEECEDLLRAVIQQAPILRDMSTAGFRGSFLLRKGQLATRDGHWLLRVERETHDIVLDRFPWGVGVIKLPWMAALLQVEW